MYVVLLCMLNLIQNLRFDRNKRKSSFSFKKDLENYNTSELIPSGISENLDVKCLSTHWISIYRKQ